MGSGPVKIQWEYNFIFSRLHFWWTWLFLKASGEEAELAQAAAGPRPTH